MSDDEQRRDSILDRLRRDQAARWQRAERVLVEEYLRADQALSRDSELVLDLIYSEVLVREGQGEHPTVDEYVARFPKHAESLQRLFAVHRELPPIELPEPSRSAASDMRATGEIPFKHAEAAPAARTARTDLPTIPGYELLNELGRGGMGVVYQARHTQLKRLVAIKMLRNAAWVEPEQLKRFRVEAEAVAALQHPNIVQIYDFGEHEGLPYLSLEYVTGGSLESWTRPPLRDIRACAALVEVLARAMAYAHRQQIVHRDLKPANILLEPIGDDSDSRSDASSGNLRDRPALVPLDCRPKITDFGLAKRFAEDSNLTHSEAILGTGAYMSPEQAWGRSRDVGPPTDIHALGVILYELLTGQTPFKDESLMRTLDRVRFETAEPPSRRRAEVPPALDTICGKCLAKDPRDRYATADDLADDLRRFLEGAPLAGGPLMARGRQRRRVVPLLATGLALAAMGGLAWMGQNGMTWRADSGSESTVPGPSTPGKQPLALSTHAIPRTRGESFAFLVGVRSYRLGEQSIDLAYTEADVDELSRVLLKQGYARKNIRLMTQWSEADNPTLAPTAANIRRQLREQLTSCIPDDTVLVAVTGMGGDSGPESTYCYLPADAQLDQQSTLLPITEFYDLFRDCPARSKLLLVDTCQTAAIPNFAWPASAPPPGTAVLFACSPREASYEHDTLRHGVFSYHVLRALEGRADGNKDRRVTLDELFAFTRSGVQAFLKQEMPGAVQTPRLVQAAEGTFAEFRLPDTSEAAFP